MSDEPSDKAKEALSRAVRKTAEELLAVGYGETDAAGRSVYTMALIQAAVVLAKWHDTTEEEFLSAVRKVYRGTTIKTDEDKP